MSGMSWGYPHTLWYVVVNGMERENKEPLHVMDWEKVLPLQKSVSENWFAYERSLGRTWK